MTTSLGYGVAVKKKVLVLVCDICGKEGEDVATRELSGPDGQVFECEAHDVCWEKKARAVLAVARPTRRRRVTARRP